MSDVIGWLAIVSKRYILYFLPASGIKWRFWGQYTLADIYVFDANTIYIMASVGIAIFHIFNIIFPVYRFNSILYDWSFDGRCFGGIVQVNGKSVLFDLVKYIKTGETCFNKQINFYIVYDRDDFLMMLLCREFWITFLDNLI